MSAKQADTKSAETVEQAAQRVMDQRGYLVISTFYPPKIGEVIKDVEWGLSPGRHPTCVKPYAMLVIAETDREDHREQARIAGWKRWENPRMLPRYFRVIAE